MAPVIIRILLIPVYGSCEYYTAVGVDASRHKDFEMRNSVDQKATIMDKVLIIIALE